MPRPQHAQPLAGSAQLWVAEVQELSRAHAVKAKPFDPVRHAVFARPPAPFAGLTFERPRIMGIVNVTPDSFSDGGKFANFDAAVAQAQMLVADGADILDIGGESTRPGAAEVPVDEEISRTAPVIAALRAAGVMAPISIDTRKGAVAKAATEAGANMINDVSALTWDAEMARVAADSGAVLCLMHAQGTPQTMQSAPQYEDVRFDVYDYLARQRDVALAAGVEIGKIMLDPGIGFGKTVAHNIILLQNLSMFHALGCPLLLGASRKRFIGVISGVANAADRIPGSVAVALHAAAQGAQVIRVHDVAQTRQALSLWEALTTDEGTLT
jgi:dihydropteroate synthase